MHLLVFTLLMLMTTGFALIESNFDLEPKCAEVNGFCILESECPNSVAAPYDNLCPNQKSRGAICCKTVTWRDVSCRQSRNACMARCPERFDLGQKECASGQTCCALVH